MSVVIGSKISCLHGRHSLSPVTAGQPNEPYRKRLLCHGPSGFSGPVPILTYHLSPKVIYGVDDYSSEFVLTRPIDGK